MNLKPCDYTIKNNILVVHWNIDKSIGIINEQFTKSIFSNYADVDICIKKHNGFDVTMPSRYWKKSRFNQPICLNDALTHLTFGIYFTQSVCLLNITYLKIECNNLNLIDNLPNSLNKLVLGCCFNLQLNDLPNSIKHIELPLKYNKLIQNIPINL